ncbi:MAG: 4-hydroxythreonine-4-phosphate dehydrogenase PdxA [Bacteroidales bacterium]|nr:4-hydroxythreonine-4-phosphate dehydrogenase PdxA [Bacteroidales bacterium]
MADNQLYKIGITHGDLNGVGYEVIIKALADHAIMDICTPVVYGLAKAASYHRKYMDMPDFSFQFIKNIEQTSQKRPNLLNIYEEEVKIDLGTSTKVAGQLAERALVIAGKDLKNKMIDAVVTAPVNKNNIQSDKFKFHGQTEFFEYYFGGDKKAMMMMVAENLRVGFVTNHEPISQVSSVITQDRILNKLEILNHSLRQDFAIDNPKIAVLALNPHAGDDGLLGSEEKEIIHPAIERAFQNKINAFGPFPADGFFASGQYRQFDAVLAMYHDQGMIPFKILGTEGVNFTAGLPIVRTSPAHGTAYDIAGKNIANGQSMRNAIYLALDILRNRNR